MASWRVTIRDYKDEKYYGVLLILSNVKYKISKPFYYKETEKQEAWHEALEYATKLEKDLMSILGNDDIMNSD
tara:strand:- start:89 stop:307 length:219 start_codon:yes stop_codon:yes gene_type:complete